MSPSFIQLEQQLQAAKSYHDLFGASNAANIHRQYRAYASIVHPDRNPDRQHQAAELFMLLQRLYKQAIEHHTPLVIETQRSRYVCESVLARGIIADLYQASTNATPVLLKIAGDARDADMMDAERQALGVLDRALSGQAVRAHFPTLLEHAQIRDTAGARRQVHVFANQPGMVSLQQVLHVYPLGLHTADAAWMFNRLLATLGLAHDQGIVHGAVLLPNVWIQPDDHNGMLADWCYSVPIGEPLRAMHPQHASDYPPEVRAKRPATPATDIFMAARCMVRLLGGSGDAASLPAQVPKPVRALLASCLIAAPARRANNAWQLLDDFRTVLAGLYGPPHFRSFVMPPFEAY